MFPQVSSPILAERVIELCDVALREAMEFPESDADFGTGYRAMIKRIRLLAIEARDFSASHSVNVDLTLINILFAPSLTPRQSPTQVPPAPPEPEEGMPAIKERVWIDPPSGWRYNFPKIYDPKIDTPDIVEWLVENGYPDSMAKKEGMYFRMWRVDESK